MIKGTWQEANAHMNSNVKMRAAWAALLGIVRRLDGRDVTDARDPETPVKRLRIPGRRRGRPRRLRALAARATLVMGLSPRPTARRGSVIQLRATTVW